MPPRINLMSKPVYETWKKWLNFWSYILIAVRKGFSSFQRRTAVSIRNFFILEDLMLKNRCQKIRSTLKKICKIFKPIFETQKHLGDSYLSLTCDIFHFCSSLLSIAPFYFELSAYVLTEKSQRKFQIIQRDSKVNLIGLNTKYLENKKKQIEKNKRNVSKYVLINSLPQIRWERNSYS